MNGVRIGSSVSDEQLVYLVPGIEKLWLACILAEKRLGGAGFEISLKVL